MTVFMFLIIIILNTLVKLNFDVLVQQTQQFILNTEQKSYQHNIIVLKLHLDGVMYLVLPDVLLLLSSSSNNNKLVEAF